MKNIHVGYSLVCCPSCKQYQPFECWYVRRIHWIIMFPIVEDTKVKFGKCDVCRHDVEFEDEPDVSEDWERVEGIPGLAERLDLDPRVFSKHVITHQSVRAVFLQAIDEKPIWESIPLSIWIQSVVIGIVCSLLGASVALMNDDELFGTDAFGAGMMFLFGGFLLGVIVLMLVRIVRRYGTKFDERVREVRSKYPENPEVWVEVSKEFPEHQWAVDALLRGG